MNRRPSNQGHAAGIAAKLAIDGRQAVQAIDVAALQAGLREQKGVLGGRNGDGAETGTGPV
jgi:hypothetical protein